ncbi:MAG TPA: protein kinase [Kofleriaceae bacterium]|nr:protein kinase [Kofleriaceae bacterium]
MGDHPDWARQSTMNQRGGEQLVGRVIGGKYQIVRLLGEGGMGTVYQAQQRTMNRMVALKLIRPDVVGKHDAVARFHKEMMVTAKIEHPNTVRLYDFGEDDGQLYLAMEFLAGVSLRHVIDKVGRLDLLRTVRIARQVGNALGACHEHGVVHRDLKPDNVMLLESYGERDFVKVLDFGIAKSLDQDLRLTETGRPIGTPAYMAPEQAMGRAVDARTDLYALGVMLYRMTSGRVPFDAPTMGSMLLAHATQPPPPVRTLAPDTSPQLAELIMQLLEKEPAARPATAAEVVARLDACAQEVGAMATVADARGAGGRPARRTGLVVAVVGGLAAMGGGVAFLATRPPAAERGTQVESDPAQPRAVSPEEAARRHELDELLGASEPLAPDGCRATDGTTLGRLIGAARALGQDGGAEKAIILLGEQPGPSAEAWALLARAQLQTAPERAEASAAEAVRLCPGYAVAHNVSGNALQKQNKASLAEDAYVRALTAAPMYDAPRFNLGLLQLRQNDATAIATFTELLHRRPDHPNAHLARAQAYNMVGKNDEALADLEVAVQQQPASAEAWALLGQLREHLQKGDAQAAYCRAKELGHPKAAQRCRK